MGLSGMTFGSHLALAQCQSMDFDPVVWKKNPVAVDNYRFCQQIGKQRFADTKSDLNPKYIYYL